MTFAFGGPNNYTGESMKIAHRHAREAGMDESHFNLVVRYLREAMNELGVAEELITRALEVVGTTKVDIVG